MNPDYPPTEKNLSGTIVSGGIAAGTARLFFNTNIHSPLASTEQPNDGWVLIKTAIQEQLKSLEHRISHGGFCDDSAAVSMLEAYRVFLLDPIFHASLQDELQRNGDRAAEAIQSTCKKWIGNFEQISNGQMQPKSLLIADLGKMLLDSMAGSIAKEPLVLTEKHILVADHLFVSDTVALHRMRPAAIVVQHGHPASHGLILARELEIPILCQVRNATRLIDLDAPLIVDAEQGRVIVHPSQKIDVYRLSVQTSPSGIEPKKTPPIDVDGTPIRVFADVGCATASARAAEAGADGIGLLRMEPLYTKSDHALRTDEIVRQLSEILVPMVGKPVYVRLLDAGGDKPLPYVKDSLGGSAMTGYRGIRLLAAHPELLRPQLQALLKLSRHHDLHILVPMATVAEDMRRVREALATEAEKLGIPLPPLGAMIETPAAALMADRLWEWSDFMRIGSNDLTQYTMAASRENPLAEGYYQQTHPAVLNLIGKVCRSEAAELIGLCGSLADREDLVPELLKLGIRNFTVPPRSIKAIRQAVFQVCETASAQNGIFPLWNTSGVDPKPRINPCGEGDFSSSSFFRG